MNMTKSQKTIIFASVGVILLGAVGYLAYSATTDKSNETVSEESSINIEDDSDNNNLTSPESLVWPSVIPSEFPEYTDGKLVRVPEETQSYSPYLVWVENTSESAVIDYIKNLEAQGFTIEEEGHAYGDEDTAWMLTKGEAYGVVLALTYGSDSASDGLVITFSKS